MIFRIAILVAFTILILLYYFNTGKWHTFSMWVAGFWAARSEHYLTNGDYVETLFALLPTIAILIVILLKGLSKHE